MEKVVYYKTESGVATLTLNRPERINAFNWELLELLSGYLEELKRDESLFAVKIEANGDKGFCSGVDLGLLEDLKSPSEARQFALLMEETMLRLFNFPLPVISLIHGIAFGGGFGIALSSDIRLLNNNSDIRFPAVRIGAILPITCTIRLNHLAGVSLAKELILTGRSIKPEEAVRRGLAHFRGTEREIREKTDWYLENIRQADREALILQKTAANQQIVAEISKYAVQSAENFAYFYASGNWKQLRKKKAAKSK
jgi:enoyl-CoA hydratase